MFTYTLVPDDQPERKYQLILQPNPAERPEENHPDVEEAMRRVCNYEEERRRRD